MKTINSTSARKNFFGLINEVSENHEELLITGKNANVVMISEEDWRAIKETLYLCSIPQMRESIIEGGNMDVNECKEDENW